MIPVGFLRRTQETALAAVSCLCVCVFLSACSSAPEGFSDLFLEAPQPGVSASTMSGIVLAQQALEANPKSDTLPYTLSYLYLQAARENADTDLYDRVESVIERVEDHGFRGPEHDFVRGLVAMAEHEFERALALAEPLVRGNPEVQRYYGLLADAQIELGKYDEAIETLQAMADINPDPAAMTRIAYVREIHGDREGAKEAMEEVAAQQTGENAAWSLCELARLWLQSEPDKADILYDRALGHYPDYAPALAGKAKAAMLRGDKEAALEFADRAFKILPLPEYATLLGEIHEAAGDRVKAGTYYKLVHLGYAQLERNGTNVDLEKVRFLLDHDSDVNALEGPVERALELHQERGTIYTADVAAWALFRVNSRRKAWEIMQDALATGTRDPLILFHAGIIAKSVNEDELAKQYLETVKSESPTFSFLHAKELEEALKSL